MPGTPTTRYGIPTLAGADLARDIDTNVNSSLASVDSKMVGYSAGTLGSRPTSTGGSPGIAGRRYRATDTGQEFIDTGTSWVEVVNDLHGDKLGLSIGGSVRRGKSIIATEEARTNVAFGLMTTPDRVQGIVLPTDGFIVLAYQAMLKSSVAGAGSAAVFIGANQLQVATQANAAPVTAVGEATSNGSAANTYKPLTTSGAGLQSTAGAVAYTGDVTTGQATGIDTGLGRPIYIFAAAGTYDVSIQFKATSGSVTVKGRKLWVWTMGF